MLFTLSWKILHELCKFVIVLKKIYYYVLVKLPETKGLMLCFIILFIMLSETIITGII